LKIIAVNFCRTNNLAIANLRLELWDIGKVTTITF
jgi:hypothetical protein